MYLIKKTLQRNQIMTGKSDDRYQQGSGHRPAPYERVCVGQSNVELALLQPILLVAAATVIFANIAERRLEGI
jgi:hypothetical protein